jgi:hypothetical protein
MYCILLRICVNYKGSRSGVENADEVSTSQTEIIREYLLHVLQYGTPEERLKILGGVKSKFELRDRQLQLLN